MSEAPGPRGLPSVDRVLRTGELQEILAQYAREPVVRQVRAALAERRRNALSGDSAASAELIAEDVARRVRSRWQVGPRPVINATGVILHTNLGRAPLSAEAIQAMRRAAGYVDLEIDGESGHRGSRQRIVSGLLEDLTGAPAALVAGNNAAAVVLALAVVAPGKEVLVSRGHAVEIGGGFRIPSILRQSRAKLVDVGTTNRTRLADYEEAISDRTAAILHVHPSNFRIEGFAEEPVQADLAVLAHRHDISLVADNGSGALLNTARFGLRHEPTPLEALAAGADLVAFSGDKLLGGPQCGILLGRQDLIAAADKHPLARTVRPGKLTLAALAATLLAYVRGDAEATLPIWTMIRETQAEVRDRAESWARRAGIRGLVVTLHDGESTVGGGSLPGETLPTMLIKLPRNVTAESLRQGSMPVHARTNRGRTYLDLRTVRPEQEDALLETVLLSRGV